MRVTDTFDFVVVGGGSGGCTVAGRLSEDPNISVAVLDAGGKNDNWVGISAQDPNAPWPHERDPFLLETSLPGVFVAGDVRHRSIKRVASAVGEGSMAVQFIHQYLADT